MTLIKSLIYFFTISLISSFSYAASDKATGQLVIVTTYPSTMTNLYRREFEKLHSDVDIVFKKMKTGSAIDHIESSQDSNSVDLMWASSTVAFEVLKSKSLLQAYRPQVQGIPSLIAGLPLHDKEGYYSGFALSGFGFMHNNYYLKAKGLESPKSWEELTNTQYKNHLGISSPSRSGTTHIMIESILQAYGWEEGWDLIRHFSSNMNLITKKSGDVPKQVKSGKVGIGAVIDFYGLTAKANHYPVDFNYPTKSTFLPASIGMIKNAPNSDAAKLFIDFLLSADGQNLLLDKNIRRIPIRPDVFKSAPSEYPNPFKKGQIHAATQFDINLSKQRYNLVNSIFDNMITFNFDALKSSYDSINQLEKMLKTADNPEANSLLALAQSKLQWHPVKEELSTSKDFTDVFKKKRKQKSDPLPADQLAIESRWDDSFRSNYEEAKALAEQGLSLLASRKEVAHQ